MSAGRALLDPADMEGSCSEVHLIPAKINCLGRTQAMAISQQDHRGVAMAPAISPGRCHDALDLSAGQVFAGTQIGVRKPPGRNCSFYGGWHDQLEVRFRHANGPPVPIYCARYNPFTDSQSRRVRSIAPDKAPRNFRVSFLGPHSLGFCQAEKFTHISRRKGNFRAGKMRSADYARN